MALQLVREGCVWLIGSSFAGDAFDKLHVEGDWAEAVRIRDMLLQPNAHEAMVHSHTAFRTESGGLHAYTYSMGNVSRSAVGLAFIHVHGFCLL